MNPFRLAFIIIPLILIPIHVFSQNIPNNDFEDWTLTNQGIISFEEPSSGFWTSLNNLAKLGGPVSVTKSTDAYSGNYSVKLETKQWGTLLIPGLLVTGEFVTTSPFVLQGKPFTYQPERFSGYCKYFPINGDSAAIYAVLTKWNSNLNRRDTLAEAKNPLYTQTPQWTLFDAYFDYYSNETPDSVNIVFSPSAASANFVGEVGSTLYIDNIDFHYSSNIWNLQPENTILKTYPVPTQNTLFYKITPIENGMISIYSVDGSLLYQKKINNQEGSVDISFLSTGIYFINFSSKQTTITRKIKKLP